MAIFEANGTAYNTDHIAWVGPAAEVSVGAGSVVYAIAIVGREKPRDISFKTMAEAVHSRNRLLEIMNAHDAQPR